MHKKLFLLILLFLSAAEGISAQKACTDWLKATQADTLKTANAALLRLGQFIQEESPYIPCLRQYYMQHFKEDKRMLPYFYSELGRMHVQLNNYDSALHFLALSVAEAPPEERKKHADYRFFLSGNIEILRGDYPKAVAYFEEYLDSAKWDTDYSTTTVNVLTNMGTAYHEMGQPGNAMAYFTQALHRVEMDTTARGHFYRKAMIEHNIGICMMEEGKLEKAQKQFLALEQKVSAHHPSYPYMERLINNSIGKTYLDQGNLDKAQVYLEKVFQNFSPDLNQINFSWQIMELYTRLQSPAKLKIVLDTVQHYYQRTALAPGAEYYFFLGQHALLEQAPLKTAVLHFHQALDLAQTDSMDLYVGRALEALSKAYSQQQDFAKAYQYASKLAQWQKKRERSEQIRMTQDYTAAYELSKYLQQAEMAEKKASIAAQQAALAKRRAQYTTILTFLGLLSAFLMGLSFYQYRKQAVARQEANHERSQRLTQEKAMITRQLEYQQKAVIDKSLWAAGLRNKVRETIERYHKRPEYLLRKIHLIFTESDTLPTLEKEFELFYPEFARQIISSAPGLTQKQIRYAMLFAMELSNKEVAEIMSVTPKAAAMARYRLREQLGLKEGDEQLDIYLRNILLQSGAENILMALETT